MRTKCDECGGKIIKKKIEYCIFGVSLGKFTADVCEKCGETCFDENTSRKMTQIAKEKGLWNLETKTKVGKRIKEVVKRPMMSGLPHPSSLPWLMATRKEATPIVKVRNPTKSKVRSLFSVVVCGNRK